MQWSRDSWRIYDLIRSGFICVQDLIVVVFSWGGGDVIIDKTSATYGHICSHLRGIQDYIRRRNRSRDSHNGHLDHRCVDPDGNQLYPDNKQKHAMTRYW